MLLFFNLLLNLLALVLLLDFLNLHELVVYHLLRVLNDPLSYLSRVYLFGLLTDFGCIFFLLLVYFLPLLHGYDFFVLPLCLDVSLCLFALYSVDLSLLLLNFALQISVLLCLHLLHLGPILCLFFNFLHHGDFLSLHFADLVFHGLSFQLLAIESLCQLRLLSLLLLQFFQL